MRIRNYSNTLSYEVITMALRTSRRTVPDNGYSSQYLCDTVELSGVAGRRDRGQSVVGGRGDRWIAVSGLGACIHFQKTFVFVRYSFVERVLNIYLWGIRQPVARPRNPSKSTPPPRDSLRLFWQQQVGQQIYGKRLRRDGLTVVRFGTYFID